MADSRVECVLKEFKGILNAPVGDRTLIFQNVSECLNNYEMDSNAIKTLAKIIGSTLIKFEDPSSQLLVNNLILDLIKTHHDLTIQHINAVLKILTTKELVSVSPTKALKPAAHAFAWTVLVVRNANRSSNIFQTEWNNFVQYQSVLYQIVVKSAVVPVKEYCEKLFIDLLKIEDIAQRYNDSLVQQKPSTESLLFLIILLRATRKEDFPDLRMLILERFVTTIIKSNAKAQMNIVMACQSFLNTIEKKEFEDTLLPPLHRSMLRSPEIILESVGPVIKYINLKFDPYALQLGKVLLNNLTSKDSSTRKESVDALKELSKKCFEVKTITTLLNEIFSVLNGAEGKITIAELRMNLLQGIGNLSFNSIHDDDRYEVLNTVAEHFSKTLVNEPQEKVICHALDMFSLWTIHFTGNLPEKIGAIFERGLELKSTSPVRLSYLQCLLASIHKAKLLEITKFHPMLLKIFENGAHNGATQNISSSEAICAACIILKTSTPNYDNSLTNFWNTIFDLNNQVFFSERFFQSASGETIYYIALLAQLLITRHYHKLKGLMTDLFKSLALCLFNNSPKVQSCYMDDIINNITHSSEGVLFVKEILIAFENSVATSTEKLISENEMKRDSGFIISPSDTIQKLCSFDEISLEDAQSLALQLMLVCHYPFIYDCEPNLWENILKINFKLDPKSLLSLNITYLQDTFINNFKLNKIYEKALETIVRICPEVVLPLLIVEVQSHLNRNNIINVTDEEYFIYLTPDGELYDKNCIPNTEDIYLVSRVKRENKAYTYKEQLEEMQLRREIDEKRRKEGKIVTPQYTVKQQQAIRNQMEKEKAIRARLIAINNDLQKVVSILKSACAGNPEHVSLYFSKILNTILNALKSPLAASPLVELYYDLHSACFTGRNKADIGSKIAIATLRLSNPHCDLNESWCETELNDCTVGTLIALYESVNMGDRDSAASAGKITKELLNAASFSYAFQFLNLALTSKFVENDEDILLKGIQLIEDHAQLRGGGGDDIVNGELTRYDFKHPKYMPRLEMFRLLLKLIKKHRGAVQIQATSALLEVAKMTSGRDNCAEPTVEELELLLESLKDSLDIIRESSLRALILMQLTLLKYNDNDNDMNTNGTKLKDTMTKRIWIAKFDLSAGNQSLANALWEAVGLQMPVWQDFLDDLVYPESCIQKAAAAAVVPILSQNSNLTKKFLSKILSIYNEKLEMIPAELDEFQREILPPIDQWKARRGVAISIAHLSPLLAIEDVNQVMQFMVSQGLGDREEIVQKEMLATALAVVEYHGKETITQLLPVFEDFLDKAPKSQSFDNVRQAVVILMGSLARHLEKDDHRVEPIVRRLLSALSTPSQQVQEAVSNCLPHLIPSVKDEAPAIVKRLLQTLVKSDKYGERRGSAYGIAGIVKGLGILSLKQLDIMSKLTTYIQEKKNYKYREGALFAFEVLCTTLGRLFEPYIVHILPHLLQCFGDSSQYVRQAADDTAKVVMAKLSAHGVKLVLPSLLDALDEDSWRTKTASVELLGAMAFCAPKQLSSCLPNIVPKLIEVLGDSHTKVQEAGADALRVIGSVIRNPEIQAIVPVLLKALEDPSKNTSPCLHSLLQTKFVHFIDAPSLALIMPVVQRAFMDRSTETRKMAAQIIGNMYSLTDQKDLTPYLPHIIPGLKMSLLDPVPEVRAVSSRALGAMVRGMGESSFDDLLPWLMQVLTSEASSVDRSGAAQGLSEVVGGLGVEKLHKIMPDIIATAERSDIAPHVKDGYIMMFIYMPAAFPQEFTPYIGQIINPILKALADESEYVRDTALKAGQRIVNLYAESAVTLLLPELEKGLFDDNWRIRFSSVQLLGDLLYRISGVSGKMTTETASEDDNFGTEQSHQAIIRFLGEERRNRVLSGLYMGRSDVSLMVRQAALHVWKVVVTNTPRTLKEILPTLFILLLGCLASTSYDKRQVAARTLGDLVRKLGERVLPEIIPILERGLNSEQADTRQGVCIGLSEIMASTSKDMVLLFVNSLVPTVRKALCDPLPEVRQAAAKTFESLHSTVGSRALDDILPVMLKDLSAPDPILAENTLDGLRNVVSIKPKVVLPYLVPQLTSPPSNTKALSILVSVAGEALTKYLPKILAALLQALSETAGTAAEAQELEYCQNVILSVEDEVGIRTIMDVLMTSARSDNIQMRKSAAILLSVFCMHSPGDYSQYISQLLRSLLRSMAESDKDILQRTWDALNAVVKTLDPAQQIAHVSDVRQAVRFAASEIKQSSELPGFCLPKGIAPLLPVFREAILNGLPEEKENAAQGLGEVIALTSAPSLQPSVVNITGPLIRILGDRFNAGVKAAVLETLAILLHKVGVMLKQFLPQLQTTFLKALHDQNRTVRVKAGQALSKLVLIHTRADPLFNEIHNNLKVNDDPAIKETMLHALRSITTAAGDKMSEAIRKQIFQTLLSMLNIPDETLRIAVGGCLGSLLKYLSEEQINEFFDKYLFIEENDESPLKHGSSIALYVGLKENCTFFITSIYNERIMEYLVQLTSSSKISIACNGVRGITFLMQGCMLESVAIPHSLISSYIRSMNHKSNEVKQIFAKSCNYLAKNVDANQLPLDVLKYIVPMLVNGTKEKNSYVKSNSEIALLSILRLREDDMTYQKLQQVLEIGAKESLTEVVIKVLRKAVLQPIGKDEELDESLLS